MISGGSQGALEESQVSLKAIYGVFKSQFQRVFRDVSWGLRGFFFGRFQGG